MSASNAFGSPIVRTVDGKEVHFKRTSGDDYGVLEGIVKERNRVVERALLDETQVVGKPRIDALREMELRPVFTEEVVWYINTKDGLRRVLTMASDAATAEAVMKGMPFLRIKKLVAEITELACASDPQGADETGKPTPPSSAQGSPASNPAV